MRLGDLIAKIKVKKEEIQKKQSSRKADSDIKTKDKRNRPIVILRLLSFLIIFLLILALMFTFIFVYNSVTNSIGYIQTIVNYKKETQVYLIEFSKLDKIEKYWQEKIQTELPVITRNPFLEPQSAVIVTSTPQTPAP